MRLPGLFMNEGWEVQYHYPDSPSAIVAIIRDMRRCDLIYRWGGRITLGKFLWVARTLGKNKLVMLWAGSDILFAKKQYAAGKMDPWIKTMIHWAVSPWVAEEVRSIGLSCEYVKVSFVAPVERPAPLPEAFSVLAYVPSLEKRKRDLYGCDVLLEVARALPSMNFTIVGVKEGHIPQAPPNVRVVGWVNDLTRYLNQATVVWRPVRHDGLSIMVLEALARGRHVLYTYDFAGCIQASGAAVALKELGRLMELRRAGTLGLNREGIEAIARDFTPEKARAELRRRWEHIILPSGGAITANSEGYGPKGTVRPFPAQETLER
jgi:hypothetical protein